MRSTPSTPVPGRKWRPRDIILGADGLVRPLWRAVAFLVLTTVLGSMWHMALLREVTSSLPKNAGRMLAQSVLIVTWLLLSWVLLAALDRRSFRVLGLWFYPAWARELFVGIGIGSGMMAVVVGLQAAFGAVRYAGVGPAPQAALTNAAYLAAVFFVWAAFEEVVLRGYAFQRLVDSVGRLAAIAIFPALLAVGHSGTPGATWFSTVNTVLQGVLFGVAYLKTRALWMPIGLHFAWNYTMMVVLSVPVSGLSIIRFGEKVFRVELFGPEWLSGGAYGPEGSVVLTVAAAALLVWMVRTPLLATSAAMNDILKKREATPPVEVK